MYPSVVERKTSYEMNFNAQIWNKFLCFHDALGLKFGVFMKVFLEKVQPSRFVPDMKINNLD